MKTAAYILTFGFIATILVSGCDSVDIADSERFVHPTVSVYFVNEEGGGLRKNQAILDVELVVTTVSGQDFSPDPVEVNDTIESQVTFDLVLPPDSVYGFLVRFVDVENDRLVGEGGVLQLITEESAQVMIPVVLIGDEPRFAVLPSVIDVPTSSDPVSLQMIFYGGSRSVSGLATRVNVTGPNPVAVDFQGVDLIETSGNQVSLAWQFGDPISVVDDTVGTIRVPLSLTAQFCLEISSGDARIVNREGEITVIGASGACVDVK